MNDAPDVVVIGAGIAGLATAFELTQAGIPFVLLEAGQRVGGVILSEQADGFTIDAGPDSLLVQKPDGIRLAEQLGLGNRLVPTRPPRLAYIQRGGRLHALPAASVLGIPTRVGPFVRSSLFSWPGKLRMGTEILMRPRPERAHQDESIGAFMRRHFGVEATEYLAEPLLAGIHAGDVDRLSLDALFPRFVTAERTHGSLLRAFRAAPRGPSTDGAFRSLPGGLSELVTALAARLPPASVRMGARVTAVQIDRAGRADGSYRVEIDGAPGLTARAVVVAAPAHAASPMLVPLDADLARLCGEVRYVSTGTVVMAFPRAAVRHPLNGSGFVVPRREATGILAGSWLSSKWPHRAPDDRVLLRAFVGGARDPDALEHSDAALVDRSLAAVQPLLGITGEPILTRVYRWVRANAQHEVGHLARMAEIERRLAAYPGLFVTGSGFRGVGIPDCVADGRATAKQAMGWLEHAAKAELRS